MNLRYFHYNMTHDEFGNNNLVNNYYLLFGLMFCFMLLIMTGGLLFLYAILK